MDETGVEPMTSPMLRERATNYATRPDVEDVKGWMGKSQKERTRVVKVLILGVM